ncbi:MAG TPA: hypothetical protein DCW90_20190 [Lachnospiraceae bacterium]|nr:hypothetical protein [Lachnospiraceae bacterium]
MNKYICKAKRKDNNDWVTGYYVCAELLDNSGYEHLIIEQSADGSSYKVIPETVTRCTGLRDKNGNLIFKGDVLKGFSYPFLSDGEHNYYAVVVWFADSAAFGIYTIKNPESKVRGISSGNTEYMSEWDSNNWEIIGNTYDNPELLEVEK